LASFTLVLAPSVLDRDRVAGGWLGAAWSVGVRSEPVGAGVPILEALRFEVALAF
jgi:hypothetical protein